MIVVHRQRLVSADFLIFMIRAINCVVSYLTFTARSVEFPLHVIIAMQNFTQVSKTQKLEILVIVSGCTEIKFPVCHSATRKLTISFRPLRAEDMQYF